MADPAELSAAYMESFNRRDWDAMRSMLADSVSHRFPGFAEMTDPNEVIEFYRRAEPMLGDLSLTLGQTVTDGESWCAFVVQSNSGSVPDAGLFHQWVDGRLTSYRGFVDEGPALLEDLPDGSV